MPCAGRGRVAESQCASRTWSSCTRPTAEARIGILGGTFDPVHRGHVAAAEQVRGAQGLDEVWLMPNAVPPHRSPPPLASPAHRLAMARLAIAGHPGLRVSDLEMRRPGPSYTADTVEALRRAYPTRSWVILLGADAAPLLPAWHAVDRLVRSADFVVFNRAGSPPPTMEMLQGLGFPPGRTSVVTIDAPDVSAHDARARLQRGEPADALLDPAVAAYIRAHELYQG